MVIKGLFDNIFEGKTVLVTGHTGFKGSWLSIWLGELGAEVVGYALEPYTKDDNFVVAGVENRVHSIIKDIRGYTDLKNTFDVCQPEFVFHLAAQPLVRQSYKDPRETYESNIMGVVNLLECCRLTKSVKVIIIVTSDKCYENKEWVWGYREIDTIGGYDPYSSSKGCVELIVEAYHKSFMQDRAIATVRAGNVIGGGDWREDRLVPDCIRALKSNKQIGIRSPKSKRPWQFVLEPLSGYLLLASKMYQDIEYSGTWNFGSNYSSALTVEDLVMYLISQWGYGEYKDLSFGLVQPHESKRLTLDSSKAMTLLGWQPRLDVYEAIDFTVAWYKNPKVNYGFCVKQIEDYIGKK